MTLCECGCGAPTRVAPYSDATKGWVKDRPIRFVSGHNKRRSGHVAEDRGYETACWIWQGVPHGDNGYGRVKIDRVAMPAHRWMYERNVGPVPDGLVLDHLCRVPLCVNPDHLEPVTGTENVRRGNVCKITVAAAKEIRARCAAARRPDKKRLPAGVVPALAEEFGVSVATIIRIHKGRGWR